jgi:hypothetical protein
MIRLTVAGRGRKSRTFEDLSKHLIGYFSFSVVGAAGLAKQAKLFEFHSFSLTFKFSFDLFYHKTDALSTDFSKKTVWRNFLLTENIFYVRIIIDYYPEEMKIYEKNENRSIFALNYGFAHVLRIKP